MSPRKIIQKYGGTSVGTIERIELVADRILRTQRDRSPKVAAVISAMAGETNRLVELVKQVNPNASGESYDLAISAGEQVSSALVAAAIEKKGGRAKPLLGFQLGIVTDKFHSQARIREIHTEKILQCWQEGIIPVIAGFQGISDDMNVTTLGRGGSDLSAVAVAVAVKADLCEINTDVDGFYSCDPRLVPNAKFLEKIDFRVALEMASLGSKVMHNRSVELAAKFNMPLLVRSTFNPIDEKGTWIMGLNAKEELEAALVSGVTVDKDVARVSVYGIEAADKNYLATLFSAIAKKGVNVDIIVHDHAYASDKTSAKVGFTVKKSDIKLVNDALAELKGAAHFRNLELQTEVDLAKVSVVGLGMISHHGVASQTFQTLTSNSIPIHMVSTSEIKISCVIAATHADRAVQLLHREFIES